MSEVKAFEREDRYIVIKHSDLQRMPHNIIRNFAGRCRNLCGQMRNAGAPARQFLVIESDWPEYEPAWRAIERRMTGQPADELDTQRLRADTAEAELAKANEKIDKAWNRSHALDHEGFIPGALDAWKRPVRQHLPYDFSGNPGASATQYCNGWNDCGGYWSAHASDLQQRLTSAEQRIAELLEIAQGLTIQVHGLMGNTELHEDCVRDLAALNPNPECCKVSPEDQALLDAGEYTPEELFGIGGNPSCPKCFNPNPEAESHE